MCTYPEVLDGLIGTDGQFETCYPVTLKNVRLFYRHNIVTKTRAIIFCTEMLLGPEIHWNQLRPIFYTNALQTKDKAVNLFKNLLKFDKVEVSDNPSKEIIWNKIEELRVEAS